MKKFVSLLLVVLMILCQFSVASADNGDEVAHLILAVKDKFGIDDNEFVFDTYNKNDYNGRVSYYLSWKSKDSSDYSFSPYISANIGQDGEVEYYRISRQTDGEYTLPKFTHEEIIEKASTYAKKVSPARADRTGEAVLTNDTIPSVTFERVENGIPVSGDSIQIEMSPEDLSLISYSCQWTDATFPAPDGIISKDEAKDAYKTQVGYELLYNIITKNHKVDRIYLSYASRHTSAAIDAFTGEAVIPSGAVFTYASGAMADKAEAEESVNATLSPEEIQLVKDINKMITKEDLEKLIRDIPELNIPTDSYTEGFSVNRNKYGDYLARIRFSAEDKENYYNANATVDAKTKELQSFNQYRKPIEDAKPYPTEQAKATAEKFLAKYFGDKFALTRPDFYIGNAPEYSFTYDRYEGGIRVNGDGLRVGIDSSRGEISDISVMWADVEFPSADKVLPIESIYDKVLTEVNFRLQYVTSSEYIYNESGKREKIIYKAALLYSPAEKPIYNAESGRAINRQGVEIQEKYIPYTDLNGHYSDEAATALARMGIYFEGGKLEPDKDISQEEFLKFVYIGVMGRYFNTYEDMYRSLIREKIIAESDIGIPPTRAEAIRIIVDAMGFGDAANIKGIYKNVFTDIEESYVGYIAIAGGLGIINTSPDIFRANDIMTRGEAVTVIHNYLSK